MPAISFSVFKKKLLLGEKCQTIRKPRKRPLKVGDVLKVYWKQRTKECEFLGNTKIISIVRKPICLFTEEDAVKDGFENEFTNYRKISALENCLTWFVHKYPEVEDTTEFNIITFEPIKLEKEEP